MPNLLGSQVSGTPDENHEHGFHATMPPACSYIMLDRMAVIGGSYENASGMFMRRACCEMHHSCFHARLISLW